MRNKKLLIILAICAVVIVLLVLFLTVFNIRSVDFVYYGNDGTPITTPTDAPTGDEVAALYKGKNIFVLSNETILNQFNQLYPEFHALGVVRSFPSRITLHIVRRVAALSIRDGSETIYLDAFGYVMSDQPEYETVDITSAFVSTIGEATSKEPGKKLQFSSASDNLRLDIVLETVSAIWQLKYDYSDVGQVIQRITFNEYMTRMEIETEAGAFIWVEKPEQNLTSRLINAFSVYFNDSKDLQKPGVVINVSSQGNISTQYTQG